MRRLALAAAVAVALAAPAAAFAHASLTQQTPSLRQELATAPRQVVLHFDQPVDAVREAIVVLNARGIDVARKVHAVTAQRELVASLPKLPRGAYTVRWRALSSDGHVVSGINTFGIRVPAPPVTEAVGAQGPTRTEDVVRWLYFLALAFSVGVVGFRLLAAPRTLPPAAERRFFLLAGAGAVAVLEVGILAFLLRAEDALQLPFVDFIYGDLSSLANGTRFGAAFIAMTLGYALVLALIVLAWLTERRWLLWAAFALGLAFSSGLSLSGHSAADAGHSWLSELADWAHLGSAMLWVGGLVALFAVVWPEPGLRRDAFLRFSRLATVLVAVLIGAGTYLSVLRFPHLHDLWRTGYGHVLLVKLSLVALALLWGGVHRQVVGPRLRAGGDGARIGRSLLGESAVAMAVLLMAAVLVDSKPPSRPVPPPPTAASVQHP
ncbi:MAG TPA: copper resistance protein CopC [Gaiellaceae bacterium]|nr:copper resistance protein CopC [Gaiellaceae bacterium]